MSKDIKAEAAPETVAAALRNIADRVERGAVRSHKVEQMVDLGGEEWESVLAVIPESAVTEHGLKPAEWSRVRFELDKNGKPFIADYGPVEL